MSPATTPAAWRSNKTPHAAKLKGKISVRRLQPASGCGYALLRRLVGSGLLLRADRRAAVLGRCLLRRCPIAREYAPGGLVHAARVAFRFREWHGER